MSSALDTLPESCADCGEIKKNGYCPRCTPSSDSLGVTHSGRRPAEESTFAATPHPYARTSPNHVTEIPKPEKSAFRRAPHAAEGPKQKDGLPSWFGNRPPGTIAPPAMTMKDAPAPRTRPAARPLRRAGQPQTERKAVKDPAPAAETVVPQAKTAVVSLPPAKSSVFAQLMNTLQKKLDGALELEQVLKKDDVRARLTKLSKEEHLELRDMASYLADAYARMSWML